MPSTCTTHPNRPLRHQSPRIIPFDLSSVAAQVAEAEEKRNAAYESSRKIQSALIKARSTLHDGEEATKEAGRDLDELLGSIVPAQAERKPREANLSYRVDDYVKWKAFVHFLETGKLLPPSLCPLATDEEYLAGACMGLSQDLQRYGLGRATARDVVSVNMARNLVEQILEGLMKFDFRNGPLRRRFDGTKYALKTLETLLYELSVTGTPLDDTTTSEPDAKRMKIDGTSDGDGGVGGGGGGGGATTSLMPTEEFEALRLRYEHRDNLRETLIKKCRDGQKAAKQSIYALHRGDPKKATKLLEECESCIKNELLPIVDEEPFLRSGSFSNVLEEFAEAKLFFSWLYGKEGDHEAPVGDLLRIDDFGVHLEPEEYLGGLGDLTGEVGRFAVQRGTVRDTRSVKLCLHTSQRILDEINTVGRLPGGVGKKMDQLNRAVEKLERMLYEISLSEATGRKVETATESMDLAED